jgi:TRAP-type C4-dicarboxylate transport system substrate-binding protein
MTKICKHSFTCAAALTAIATFAPAVSVSAAPQELRLSYFAAENGATGQQVLIPWINWFNARAGDAAMIKLYSGGSLGRDPTKQYKLVKDNVADMAFILPGYQPGQFPEVPMFELPGLAQTIGESSYVLWRLYKEGILHGFDEIKVVSLMAGEPPILHMMSPIKSIDDIRGKKIRVAGPIQTQAIQALGGAPVGLPVTEVTESLTRGVVQGTIIGWTGGSIFRIPESTPHHFEMVFGFNPFLIALNKDVYEKLPQNVRKAIDDSGDQLIDYEVNRYGKVDDDLRKKYGGMSGHTVAFPSKTDLEKAARLFRPLAERWVQEHGRVAYDAYLAALKDYRAKTPPGK